MPCCFDAFSAALIEHQGFDLTFVSGFAVSAARLARPDTGLISYAYVCVNPTTVRESGGSGRGGLAWQSGVDGTSVKWHALKLMMDGLFLAKWQTLRGVFVSV